MGAATSKTAPLASKVATERKWQSSPFCPHVRALTCLILLAFFEGCQDCQLCHAVVDGKVGNLRPAADFLCSNKTKLALPLAKGAVIRPQDIPRAQFLRSDQRSGANSVPLKCL